MQTLTVKNVVFGEGKPKICISIMGRTCNDLKAEIKALDNFAYDVIEWRMDYFDEIMDHEKAVEAVSLINEMIKQTPLLATFRSKSEGGEKTITKDMYVALNKAIIASGKCDLIDVEYFMGEKEVKSIVDYAHENHVYVIMSNHDFHQTPAYDEIISRLKGMQKKNADMIKIALMPTCKNDVLTLLKASLDMYEMYADRPMITMSMAKQGVVSRFVGEVFGSALTFGAAQDSSAPGQMNANELEKVLSILHNSLI